MPTKGTRSINLGKLTWLDIQDPEPRLLHKIAQEHGFHELDIEDCLSDNQRSKIDEYDDYLFIILHIAYYDKRKQRVISEEIDIFIKNNMLITVHWGSIKPLTDLFDKAKSSAALRKEIMSHGSGFLLYEVIDHLYSSAFPMLDTIERNLTSLERDVFSLNQKRDMLKDILNLKKNIIGFRRIIAPQRSVIAQIEHKNKKFLPHTLEIYFDDVVDKIEKIWSTLENLKELVESLQDTNESIISHTTNNVIKILTVFSVVMLPLTFLTGLYGMNVSLPAAESNSVFMVIVVIMVVTVASMLGFFRYKRWI
ncbi:magnesium/cobalt transporter CorA [Candidatus Peregrinibacteria bacterium]|jgi:magnesium transporter|nr:magnesium/cobalt transporter CorA [Candidatus Peregrinibacteria bacterium]MBT4631413.1 magnesium/cobalt transporter CorA [Candidatus Peregrinibacteria bacterium]MBT5517096.1 magnesium/cobalt transporter CorA [Candidatus Peregrinibacteria bacterium]MBT5824002.1 magnesium/cobalt transporter CorA [Candidatus Peregrinibacteria bacterium]